MLKDKSPQSSFYSSYLYDKIIPSDHLLRKIDQVVDFSLSMASSETDTPLISVDRRKTRSSCCAFVSFSISIGIRIERSWLMPV